MPVKVNVGLSRKVSQDYNSRGYSLNVEAELPATVINDPNAMAESVNHLFQLAEDLVNEQVRNIVGNGSTAPRRPVSSQAPVANGSNGRTGSPPRKIPVERGDSPSTNGNGSNGPRPITAAQAKAIRKNGKGVVFGPRAQVTRLRRRWTTRWDRITRGGGPRSGGLRS